MKTAEETIAEHYTCTCDEIYTSRDMVDPSCVLHEQGGEMKLIMHEYAKEVALAFYYSEESLTPEQMSANFDRFAEREGLV